MMLFAAEILVGMMMILVTGRSNKSWSYVGDFCRKIIGRIIGLVGKVLFFDTSEVYIMGYLVSMGEFQDPKISKMELRKRTMNCCHEF